MVATMRFLPESLTEPKHFPGPPEVCRLFAIDVSARPL